MTKDDATKVGDTVKVFDVNGKRRGQPEGGWDGKVLKVGRKLVTIEYPGGRWGGRQFRLEDGRANDTYGSHTLFLTLPEVALRQRRQDAIASLRRHGVEIERCCNLTAHQSEVLAETCSQFERED